MNRSSLKAFAVKARKTLTAAVRQKLYGYGRTADEKERRKALDGAIKRYGAENVVDEAAYIWFNRFIALRFMEANGYLPSKMRVFTDENGIFCPLNVKNASQIEIKGVDAEKISAFIENNDDDGLFKYVVISLCDELSGAMPLAFEKIPSVTGFLFPDGLLKKDGVISNMASAVPEDEWKDNVQLIGTLYQYYISEEHKKTVDALRGRSVKKEDLPAATQLFTTGWVVKYLLDNSLGRYWIERHPESRLREKTEYYAATDGENAEIKNENISPEELRILDPCVGAGHFLAYAFDLLMEIYRECGRSDKEAARSIIKNNLYGLDIDKRASQLACFSLLMKARKYDSGILDGETEINVTSFTETDPLTEEDAAYLSGGDGKTLSMIKKLKEAYVNAREYGSLIKAPDVDAAYLKERIPQDNALMRGIIKQTEILSLKYHVAATNPPYLNKYSAELRKFITENYREYKGDLFSVFMYRNFDFCVEDGYLGYMTPMVWMFIKRYEKLRKYVISKKAITTLIQFSYSAFEEATVPLCAFVFKNGKSGGKGAYFRLTDFRGGMELQREKTLEAISRKNCGYYFETDQSAFARLPGCQIAYFLPDSTAFENEKLGLFVNARIGMVTGDNDRFYRLWFEVDHADIEFCALPLNDPKQKKWYPLQKGGDYRLWYGNNYFIVDWENDGYRIKNDNSSRGNIRSHNYNGNRQFMEGITWNSVSSSKFHCRYCPEGFTFDASGPLCEVVDKNYINYILAFLTSKVTMYYLDLLNPTINFSSGYLMSFPFIIKNFERVDELSKKCILLSQKDWDSFETSWDFKKHPLI